MTWNLDCIAASIVDGTLDARRPHIQGGPVRRFIYLAWGEMDDDGAFTMFRRAKLWLDGVDARTAHAAIAVGELSAQVGLTDAKGHPLFAAVRPPKVTWLVR